MRRVGYQGERGAYSEVAAGGLEPGAALVPCSTLAEVFGSVAAGLLDAGVVPVENSLAGSIGETYDLLTGSNLTITGEIIIPIEHCLLAPQGVTLQQLRRVMSHPQALAQCQAYLNALPVEQVPYYDTAGAAKALASGICGAGGTINAARTSITASTAAVADTAAIASAQAAEIYGLEVLARAIQSAPENCTRFYRIETQPRSRGRHNKTALAFSLSHEAGSLFMALSPFACRSLNLTRIESRPVGQDPWQYRFYLEFEGHVDDWQVKAALDELGSKSSSFRVLGSFPMPDADLQRPASANQSSSTQSGARP